MKILVVTVYDGVTNEDLQVWADRVFAETVATQFTPEQLSEMKKDFLDGKDVLAQSKSPDKKQTAMTRWRLTR